MDRKELLILEQELANSREKYRNILETEKEIIKLATEKWNDDEKVEKNEELRKILHAIVLKNIYEIKKKDKNY